jgi:hypothetical protein
VAGVDLLFEREVCIAEKAVIGRYIDFALISSEASAAEPPKADINSSA